MSKKILFFLTWPIEDASSRYRVYQFEDILKENNFNITYNVLFPSWYLTNKNKKGVFHFFIKFFFLIIFLFKRIFSLSKVHNYDIVFIHREAFPFFTPFIEKIIRRYSTKFIYDFDDAIYLKPEKWKNWRDYLRNPYNVSKICTMADTVIVGNSFLQSFAIQYNSNVKILPTVYRTEKSKEIVINEIPIIGWIGSWSTLINLEIVLPVLEKLTEAHQFKLRLIGAMNIYDIKSDKIEIEYFNWNKNNEMILLNSIDIGIMPLINTEWERGKCSFKLIQYMSYCKPVIASPVGMNNDVIVNGFNGFLAENVLEWEAAFIKLLSSQLLRKEMGANSYNIIQDRFSYENMKIQFLDTVLMN